MRKRFIIIGLAGLCGAFFAAGVVARPVGEIRFTLENGGATPLQTLAMSRPEHELWGQDRLEGQAIQPGETIEVVLQPSLGGCLYDMKARFQSGREARLFAVDVCRLNGAEVTLSD